MKERWLSMGRLLTVLALIVGFGFTQPFVVNAADDTKVIRWTFANTIPMPGTPWWDIGTKEFGERIEKATNGRIKVRHLVGVINGLDGMTAIRDGRIQGCNFNYGYVDATYPLTNMLTMVLVPDEKQLIPLYDQVMWPVAEKTFGETYKAKLVAQGCWAGHPYYTNKKLLTVEDFKGLKLRTDSKTSAMTLNALGGSAVAMPFGELYVAVERGMVDGFISAHGVVLGSKMYDVAKYINIWPLGVQVYGIFVSQKALDDLPQDLRTAVEDELAKLRSELVQRDYDAVEVALEELKKHGMEVVVPSDEEFQKFKKIVNENTVQNFIKQTGDEGRDLLKKCYEIIGVEQY